MPNDIRLQDVAELAGVSIGTASQALNNRPNVASETRTRVIDAARTLGYPIKTPAASVKTDLKVVGMLMSHSFGYPRTVNPFYSHIQAGIERECHRQNISLMYANIEVDSSDRPLAWPPMLSEKRIDGLLLVGTFIKDTIGILKRRSDMPIVLINAYAPNLPYDNIVIDNDMGTRRAIEYLIQLGHRRIGLVGTNLESPPSLGERRACFRSLMQRHGLSEAYIEDSELTQDSGCESLKRLLERAPDVTAVFAAADIVAIGALNATRDLGVEVPSELSIIGFDNIDLASIVTPALTTVHVHKTWMGSLGVRQLLHCAAEPGHPKLTISVATDLIKRDSVDVARD